MTRSQAGCRSSRNQLLVPAILVTVVGALTLASVGTASTHSTTGDNQRRASQPCEKRATPAKRRACLRNERRRHREERRREREARAIEGSGESAASPAAPPEPAENPVQSPDAPLEPPEGPVEPPKHEPPPLPQCGIVEGDCDIYSDAFWVLLAKYARFQIATGVYPMPPGCMEAMAERKPVACIQVITYLYPDGNIGGSPWMVDPCAPKGWRLWEPDPPPC